MADIGTLCVIAPDKVENKTMIKALILGLLFQFSFSVGDYRSYVLDDIQFEINSDKLTDDRIKELEIIIKTIRESMNDSVDKQFTLWINGNSDPSEKNARRLSRNRAEIVKEQLIKLGLTNGKLITKGYGTKRPVTNSRTDEAKGRNARVEFKIGFE
jgi:outer membrane protein OmpA-like peptidoglycan-associated protein